MRIKYTEHKIKPYSISEYIPKYHWVTCNKCGDQIKKETIWSVFIRIYCWGNALHGVNRFEENYCKECFPTLESITAYCDEKAKEDC